MRLAQISKKAGYAVAAAALAFGLGLGTAQARGIGGGDSDSDSDSGNYKPRRGLLAPKNGGGPGPSVPEPAAALLFGAGLLAVQLRHRRR